MKRFTGKSKTSRGSLDAMKLLNPDTNFAVSGLVSVEVVDAAPDRGNDTVDEVDVAVGRDGMAKAGLLGFGAGAGTGADIAKAGLPPVGAAAGV
mmetsp:Transcript_124630/g.186179  ORF Transcript_124630/g.186179 Transcript_124630/m.186179 type:complete len:94 (-) Transcript_124630:329-610(-)